MEWDGQGGGEVADLERRSLSRVFVPTLADEGGESEGARFGNLRSLVSSNALDNLGKRKHKK